MRHTSSDEVRGRIHLFNSFFYKKLAMVKSDFARMDRWMKDTNLLDKDFWVVPIHDRCVLVRARGT